MSYVRKLWHQHYRYKSVRMPDGRVKSVYLGKADGNKTTQKKSDSDRSPESIKNMFLNEAKSVWHNSSMIDKINVVVVIEDREQYMGLATRQRKINAIGDRLYQLNPEYTLYISKDAIAKLSEQEFRNYIRHETIHLGYPNHDNHFKSVANANDIPISVTHDKTGVFYQLQVKEGNKYITVAQYSYEDYNKALEHGRTIARTEKKKVRLLS